MTLGRDATPNRWSPSTWGQMRRLAGIHRAPRRPFKSPFRFSTLTLALVMVVVSIFAKVSTATVSAPNRWLAARQYAKLQSDFSAQLTPPIGSCCYHATAENATLSFDSDSNLIRIDTLSSYSITNDPSDFIPGTFDADAREEIAGFGGSLTSTSDKSTVRWTIEDDDQVLHEFSIQDVAYVPSNPICLLSPQQLAQQIGDKYKHGTGEVTFGNATVLFWCNRQFSKTIKHHALTKCPMMASAQGLSTAQSFFANWNYCFSAQAIPTDCATKSPDYIDQLDSLPGIHPFTLAPDDSSTSSGEDPDADSVCSTVTFTASSTMPQPTTTVQPQIFDAHRIIGPSSQVQPLRTRETAPETRETTPETREPSPIQKEAAPALNEKDKQVLEDIKKAAQNAAQPLTDAQRELLSVHHRLGHAHMDQILDWAKKGRIPKLSKAARTCIVPRCCDCLYAKAQKRAWRTRKQPAPLRREDSKPDSRVSVDQLEVTTPGLIPQLKGKLMKAKFTCATIFVDEFSGKDFVYCQTSTNATETLAAKTACEQHFETFDVEIKAYHADNERFQENAFKQSCANAKQELTFCGVGAHHQKSLVERHIKQLSESSRAMLLHAMLRWRWVTLHLWPYALHHASYLHNHLPRKSDGKTRTEIFASTTFEQTLQHLHTFGCPVFVLDGVLQGSSGKLPRYTKRARVGIYLGHSPQHAGNVALVLNPETGLVSPQYHVVFDDDFTTVKDIENGTKPANGEKLATTYESAASPDFDLAKLWFHSSDLRDDELEVPPTQPQSPQ